MGLPALLAVVHMLEAIPLLARQGADATIGRVIMVFLYKGVPHGPRAGKCSIR